LIRKLFAKYGNALLILATIIIILVLLSKANQKELSAYWKRLNIFLTIGAFGIVSLSLMLRFWKWKILEPKLSNMPALSCLLVGQMFSILLPMRFGEPVAALMLSKIEEIPFGKASAITLIERFFQILVLTVLFFLFSLFEASKYVDLYVLRHRYLIISLILLFLSALFLFRKKLDVLLKRCLHKIPIVGEIYKSFSEDVGRILRNKLGILFLVLLTTIYWVIHITYNYFIYLVLFQMDVPFWKMPFIATTGAFGGLFLFLPGSMGPTAIVIYLLTSLGFSYTQSLASALFGNFLLILTYIIWGLPSMFFYKRKVLAIARQEDTFYKKT